MAATSELYLPRTLPYPITILERHARVGDNVRRGAKLLTYSFRRQVKDDNPDDLEPGTSAQTKEESAFGSWEAPIEGVLVQWNVRADEVVDGRSNRPVVSIEEPCTHGMQFNGLCALCGKDMTQTDFTGFSDTARANIQMTHLAGGPTVSMELARKHERETAERLLKSRKLSLIVDLDQTIVHATVDPTVGKWIDESRQWDARQAAKAARSKAGSGSGTPTGTPPGSPGQHLEENPNWEALRDVHQFSLPLDHPHAPQSHVWKGKEREMEGVLYYIKPRPGLTAFLRKMNEKYEMHVYTMGTRAYAEKVCAAIDPDGSFFRGRILSRDESGSLTAKSLQRLFPCDTSMVVIIDDRSDVWDNSPNLVNVDRYEFFKGSGDINATFLPPLPPTDPATQTTPELPELPHSSVGLDRESEENKEKLQDSLLEKRSHVLEAQIEARPLEKEQEKLDAEEQDADADAGASTDATTDHQHQHQHHHHRAVLTNDDTELLRLGTVLSQVHSRFFHLYDSRKPGQEPLASKDNAFDASKIIPWVKSQTFVGMHFLFSSLIPLDAKHPEKIPIWRQALEFGATIHTDFSPLLTHVVTAKRETAKVHKAHARGGTHVVWSRWLLDSVARWQALDVGKYLLYDDDREAWYKLRAASQESNSSSPSSGSATLPGELAPTTTSPAGAVETNGHMKPDTAAEDAEAIAADSEEMQEPDSELAPVEINWNDMNDEVDEFLDEDDEDEEGDVDYSQWDNADRSSEAGSANGSRSGSTAPAAARGLKRGRSAESDTSSVGGGKRVRRVSGLQNSLATADEGEASDRGGRSASASEMDDDDDFLLAAFAEES